VFYIGLMCCSALDHPPVSQVHNDSQGHKLSARFLGVFRR